MLAVKTLALGEDPVQIASVFDFVEFDQAPRVG
jgi:hypothetical protein